MTIAPRRTTGNEILALNDHEFLVIDRDGKAGNEAKSKNINKIDLTGATDISAPFVADGKSYDYSGTNADNGLPARGPIPGVTAVKKSAFIKQTVGRRVPPGTAYFLAKQLKYKAL